MSEKIKVKLSALEKLHNALGRYRDGMAKASNAVEKSISQYQTGLDIRASEAKRALLIVQAEMAFQDRSTEAGQYSYYELQRRQAHLERVLDNIQRQQARFEQAVADYQRSQHAMQRSLDNQIPAARVWLENKIQYGKEFLEVSAGSTYSSKSNIPSSSTGAQQPYGTWSQKLHNIFHRIGQSWLWKLASPFISLALGPFSISLENGLSIGLSLFQIDLGLISLGLGPKLSFNFFTRTTSFGLNMNVDLDLDSDPVCPILPVLV